MMWSGHSCPLPLTLNRLLKMRKPRKPISALSAVKGFYCAGGTYSFGFADPSPKKNCSNCFTITSWSSRRAGFSRYSFSSILQCSVHILHASWETLSYTFCPRSLSNGGSSSPGISFLNFTQKTLCDIMSLKIELERVPELTNLHAVNQPISNFVHMLHHVIYQQLSGLVVNHLMHVNRDPPVRLQCEILGLDVGIKHLELTLPVVPHRGSSQHPAALHTIRPIHVGLH